MKFGGWPAIFPGSLQKTFNNSIIGWQGFSTGFSVRHPASLIEFQTGFSADAASLSDGRPS